MLGRAESVQRVFEWLRVHEEGRGVAVHVYDLNAVEGLLARFRGVSGFFDPLKFFEPVVTGAENLSVLHNIALFDVLDAHRPIPRPACAT